jgi:hypothetical protein
VIAGEGTDRLHDWWVDSAGGHQKLVGALASSLGLSMQASEG